MRSVAGVIVLSVLYATLRYNVFKGVAWEEWPTFILNKAAALAALLLVVAALVQPSRETGRDRLLAAARWLILLHVGLSLVLLGPASFASFYVDGKLVATAALSMLIGTVAAASVPLLLRPATGGSPNDRLLRTGLFAFLPGLHAALLGFRNWGDPSSWPGYMVPITLISFLAGTVGLGTSLWRAAVRMRPPS
jgi:hypothetical protein